VGYGLASSWPAAYVVFSTVLHGLFVGLLLLGLMWVDSKKYLRSVEKRGKARGSFQLLFFSLLIGVNFSFIAFGLRLHFPVTLGFGASVMAMPVIWGAFVAWVFWRYGALAAVVATATNVLWTLNYPLLFMLREVGNASPWALFAGWATLIVGATLAAFRTKLKQAMGPLEESQDTFLLKSRNVIWRILPEQHSSAGRIPADFPRRGGLGRSAADLCILPFRPEACATWDGGGAR